MEHEELSAISTAASAIANTYNNNNRDINQGPYTVLGYMVKRCLLPQRNKIKNKYC